MATPTWLSGFEYGVLSASGGGLASVITGTVDTNLSVQSSVKRSGSYALRIYPSSAAAHFGRTISTNLLVGRFYVRFGTLQTADHTILRVLTATQQLLFGFSYNGGSQRFYMTVNAGTPQYTAGGSVQADVWYRVDFRFDTSTGTSTIDWQINGVAQTQATRTVATATQTTVNFGVTTAATANFYIDDCVLGYTTGDYPFGDGEVRAIVPSSDGSHNAGTNIMEDSAGADVNGTSVTAWDKLEEIPLGGGGDSDRIQQTANGTGNYCEVNFGDITDNVINGVMGLLCYKSATTSGNTAGTVMRRYDGGTPTDVALYGIAGALTDYSESSNFYKSAILGAPGGGWTQTEVNNLKMRFGYSDDAAPDIYWLGLMYEVDVKTGRISPSAIATGEAFGTAKINGRIQSAGAIATGAAFGTAKINGTIKSAGGIASGEVVPNGAAISGVAATDIRNAGAIATAEAIGSAKISGNIKPSGIASAEAFGSAKIRGTINPSGIATAEAVGSPRLRGTISPSGIASAESVPSPRLRGTIVASGIATAEAIGSAKINGKISPAGIATAEALGTPALRGSISATGIPTGEALGTPRIRGTIHASGIASGEIVPSGAALSTPSSTDIQNAGAIASAEAFGSARLRGTIHEAGDISSAEAVGAARLIGIIRAGGIASLASVNAPKINGQVRGAGAISSREALGVPEIVGIIRAVGIASAEAIGSAKLNGTIRAGGIASREAFGSASIYEAGSILIGGIPSAEAIGSHSIVSLLHPGEPCESWASRSRCGDPLGEKKAYLGAKCGPVGPKPKRCESESSYYSAAPDETALYDEDLYDESLYG